MFGIKPSGQSDGTINPAWSLAPLALGLITGAIAKAPLEGLAAGAIGGVNTLANISGGNRAMLDARVREQEALNRQLRGNRGVQKYLGVPDEIMDDAVYADENGQKRVAENAHNIGAYNQAQQVYPTIGINMEGGGQRYTPQFKGNSAGYVPVASENTTLGFFNALKDFANSKMLNTTAPDVYNDLMDNGKIDNTHNRPFDVSTPTVANELLKNAGTMRSNNTWADITKQTAPYMVQKAATEAKYLEPEKQIELGTKRANLQGKLIENQFAPAKLQSEIDKNGVEITKAKVDMYFKQQYAGIEAQMKNAKTQAEIDKLNQDAIKLRLQNEETQKIIDSLQPGEYRDKTGKVRIRPSAVKKKGSSSGLQSILQRITPK